MVVHEAMLVSHILSFCEGIVLSMCVHVCMTYQRAPSMLCKSVMQCQDFRPRVATLFGYNNDCDEIVLSAAKTKVQQALVTSNCETKSGCPHFVLVPHLVMEWMMARVHICVLCYSVVCLKWTFDNVFAD